MFYDENGDLIKPESGTECNKKGKENETLADALGLSAKIMKKAKKSNQDASGKDSMQKSKSSV